MKEWGTQGRQHYKQRGDASSSGGFERCVEQKDTSVTIISVNENDYISLTDIAKYKSDDPTAVIGNWLRNRNTI